ncbi:MAG: DUF4326 domain-containing protein, partial [Xanthobacteraceae bacterium]
MCRVLNKHHAGVPAGAVYIGRGSKWGNPFRIGPDGDRAAVIAKHERWLADQHNLLRALDELRGRDLVCFCAPLPCHGDLLRRLANATRDEQYCVCPRCVEKWKQSGLSWTQWRAQTVTELLQEAKELVKGTFAVEIYPDPVLAKERYGLDLAA